MALSHNEARDRLSELHDEELGAAEAAAVREHLDECEDCTGEYTQLAEVLELFGRVERPAVPDHFYLQVRRRVRRRAAGRIAWSGFGRTGLFGRRIPFEFFAALVLVALGAISGLVMPVGFQALAEGAPPSATRLGPATARLDIHTPDLQAGRDTLREITNHLGGRILPDDRGERTRYVYVALPLRKQADYIRAIKKAKALVLHTGGPMRFPVDLTVEVRLDE